MQRTALSGDGKSPRRLRWSYTAHRVYHLVVSFFPEKLGLNIIPFLVKMGKWKIFETFWIKALLVIYSMSVISSTIPLNPQCLMLNLSYPLSLLSIRIYHLYPITFPWMSLSNNTTYILTMANRSLNIPLNSHFNMLTFHDVPSGKHTKTIEHHHFE